MFESYTSDAQKVVIHTQEVARSMNHPAIDFYHVLLGILKVNARAAAILRSNNLTDEATRRYVLDKYPVLDTPSPATIPFVLQAKPVFNQAYLRARSLSHRVTDVEHIALVLLNSGSPAINALVTTLQVNCEKLQRDLTHSVQQKADAAVLSRTTNSTKASPTTPLAQALRLIHSETATKEQLAKALAQLVKSGDEKTITSIINTLDA